MDALRGLGMLFVILGHMTIPGWARRLIFSFHMPLFFCLSGYLYRGQLTPKWVARKVDSLLVPYLLYGIATLALWLYIGKCNFASGLVFIGMGNGLGLLWFLTCLFAVDILGALVVRSRILQGKVAWGVVVGVAALGWFIPRMGLPEVWKSNTICAALAFWLAGYLLKRHEIMSWMLIPALGVAAFFPFQRIDMNSGVFGNGFLFYGTAMGFIVVLIWLFQKLPMSFGPLVFVGRRSLEFMCLHGLIPPLLVAVALDCGFTVPKIALRVTSLFVVVGMAWSIHRYCKLLAGRALLFQRIVK